MNRWISWWMIALGLLVIVGCGRGESATPTTASSGAIPPDARITLERTVCFGACPAYVVTISADGAVRFEGKDFVKTAGVAEGSITPEELRALIQQFEAIDYWSYRDAYITDPAVCKSAMTDLPSANTSLTLNGKTKRVDHYHGCAGFAGEQELLALEKKIDEVARTSQWVGP